MEKDAKKLFPHGFLWGASTSAHQVEGGNRNQWTEWEIATAASRAKTAHNRLGWMPNWNEIAPQAEEPSNYISGNGIRHYDRYKEDFGYLKKLNLNSFRFGIEWSRVEPEEDVWDDEAWQHYRDYIRELQKLRIEPVINIWHWTVPKWFYDKGGFEKRSNIKYFTRFVQKLSSELDLRELKYLITLNEPNVYCSFSYGIGEWPPEKKNWLKMAMVYKNLTIAHNRSYKILKKAAPSLQIGIAHQVANIKAKRPHNIIDLITTQWMRYFWNWWFLNRIDSCQDFIGVNYYFADYYQGFWRKNPKYPLSDLDWYMEPEALYRLLMRCWFHYQKPVIVTENGLADSKDKYRQWWIEETMIAMERALSEGVDLKGYFHWSLLDNFEWAYGWWPKFGLIEVDRKHGMKRTIRPSAKWWAGELKKIQSR